MYITQLFKFLLITFFLSACQQNDPPDLGGGKLYKEDLLNTIKKADVIVIKEHSDEMDFYDSNLEVQKKYTVKVYKTITLTSAQKEKFVKEIQLVNNKTQDAFPACIPEIHHTITFYNKGTLFSKMAICFECGQIEWDGSKHDPPWAIYSGMEKFVNAVGLHSEQDWKKLAKKST